MINNKANTNYDPQKRVQGDIYDDTRPSVSYSEQLVSLRLQANAKSDAENVRPPIKNIGRTVPRFGYRTEPPDILDILSVDDYDAKFGDYSGTAGQGYGSTSYPSVPQL